MAGQQHASGAEMLGSTASAVLDPSAVDGVPTTSVESKPFIDAAHVEAERRYRKWLEASLKSEELSVFIDHAVWRGVLYSRVCPKCGGRVSVTGAWRVVTRLTPKDHDYAYGYCRRTAACGWRGEMTRCVDLNKRVAK